jgi:hypothetical protein
VCVRRRLQREAERNVDVIWLLGGLIPDQKILWTSARTTGQNVQSGQLLGLFEPSTEVIRKGKAGKPNEFG